MSAAPKPTSAQRGQEAFREVKNYLSEQKWYYGLVIREDSLPFLQKTGDWLCRCTDSHGFMEVVMSVKTLGDVHHYYLGATDKHHKWFLVNCRQYTFKNIDDLITFYKTNKMPCGIYLQNGVPRPNWLISHEYLTTNKRLGSGNFAEVFSGAMTSILGASQVHVSVAIKQCKPLKGKCEAGGTDDLTARAQMFAEAKLMSQFTHENIIKLYGFACDDPPIKIVMELCPGGSIRTHLQIQQEEISNAEKILYAYEAAKGMRYLHQEGCVHRDLAARNCLIGRRGNIKICDFGLSKVAAELQGLKFDSTMHMPVRWMAPETLRRHPRFSVKSDVWAFGVLIFEIFDQGVKPWPDVDFCKIVKYIRHCNMPDPPYGTPAPVCEIMSRCWVANAQKRPTFAQLCDDLRILLNTKFPLPPPCQLSIAGLEGVTPDSVAFEEVAYSEQAAAENSIVAYIPRQLKMNEDDLKKIDDDDTPKSDGGSSCAKKVGAKRGKKHGMRRKQSIDRSEATNEEVQVDNLISQNKQTICAKPTEKNGTTGSKLDRPTEQKGNANKFMLSAYMTA